MFLSICDLSLAGTQRLLVIQVFINRDAILKPHITSKSSGLQITAALNFITSDFMIFMNQPHLKNYMFSVNGGTSSMFELKLSQTQKKSNTFLINDPGLAGYQFYNKYKFNRHPNNRTPLSACTAECFQRSSSSLIFGSSGRNPASTITMEGFGANNGEHVQHTVNTLNRLPWIGALPSVIPLLLSPTQARVQYSATRHRSLYPVIELQC